MPVAGGDTSIKVRFDASDGRDVVSWRARCNAVGGPVLITADELHIEIVSGTAIGCDEEWYAEDAWISKFMGSIPSWTLDGTHLTLRSGETVIELQEVPTDDFWT